MSKILVIEPYRMLQQAISMALFPDHEVQPIESLPADTPREPDVDMIILDAASLRAKNALGSPLPQWIQQGRIPIVWVDNEDPTAAPKVEKLIVVQSPLTKERLLAAVAHCLGSGDQRSANRSLTDLTEGHSSQSVPVAEDAQIIELVDAVDEKSESKKSESDREK